MGVGGRVCDFFLFWFEELASCEGVYRGYEVENVLDVVIFLIFRV